MKLPRESPCPPPLDKEVCENNGTCYLIETGREQGAYICKCAEGYYGTTCEYRDTSFHAVNAECPEEVKEFLCLHGGTCNRDTIENRPFYYCECMKPYHGVRCELSFIKWLSCPPPWNTELCLHGGVCSQVTTHFPSLYFCDCTEEHFGARCEHCFVGKNPEHYPCPAPLDTDLCKNGGTCIAPRLNPFKTAFNCICPEGLYGPSCEYPYSIIPVKAACPSDMEITFCLNGGTCYKEKMLGQTVHMCECNYPYSGERCELMSIHKLKCPQQFDNILCLSGGTCTYRKSNGYNIYICECPEGSYGTRCEHTWYGTIDKECPQDFNNTLCMNGGICFAHYISRIRHDVYYCKCVAGFFGVLCEFPHSSVETTSAFCPPDIAANYCKNGGTCYVSRLTGDAVYYCCCPDPFYGITCEFRYPLTKCPHTIAEHLCVNGTCFQQKSNGVDTYQCECLVGYYGARCEYDSTAATQCAEPFSSQLCKNNGTCVRITPITGAFILRYCECPDRFYGTACEIPYNPALEKLEPCWLDVAHFYCLNGGTCYRVSKMDQLASFCECVEPYYGTRCQYSLPLESKCPFAFDSFLCLNGFCTQRVSHGEIIYVCVCEEGFYGYRCEHKQVEISLYETCPHPLENEVCANAGSCVATIYKENCTLYFCKCMEGYYGMSCEYKKPVPDYKYCPAEIANEWCLHSGTCYAEYTINNVVYRCVCAPPYYGERCEKHPFIQPLCPSSMNKNLCQNGGICSLITINGNSVYYCKCSNRYYGSRCEYCEIRIVNDLCPSHLITDLCKNGGTCIKILRRQGEYSHYCKCPEGLFGLSCEYPYPRLATLDRTCPACVDESYCLHGGTCYKEDIMGHSKYHCECVYPYQGERCEVKYPQQLNCPIQFMHFLCLNNGTCVQGKSNGYRIYTCLCQDGYYGPRCEHICGPSENPATLCEDPFSTELCKNGGTCVSLKFPGGYDLLFCKCQPGLFGLSCEYPFLPLFHEDIVCPPEVAKDFCLNGGSCYVDVDPEDTFYYCFCPEPYFGERCELSFPEQTICPSEIGVQLCLNGGTCVQQIHSHYIYLCLCADGFYGPHCEFNKHPTDPYVCPSLIDKVLCMNGGTCVVLITEKEQQLYFCKCVEGFYGMICEHKIPPEPPNGEICPPVLENNWCLNGGTCYVGNVMGITVYYCHCVEPFSGDKCEMEFPGQLPCPHLLDKFLCINGGVCSKRILHQYPGALYYCDCPIGFIGARCEMTTLIERKVRYCSSFKWFCLNGGVCIKEEVDVEKIVLHCDCKKGYFGERCQLKAKEPEACPPEQQGHICFNGGTCIIGFTSKRKTPYCECQAGYLGQRCEFPEPKVKPHCPSEISAFLCLNGGTCLEETIDKQRLYYCECPEQNFGLRCEYESPKGDSCLIKDFCLNGGTCYSFEFSHHAVYYCVCESDYHGSLCQYPIQEHFSEKLCPPEIADWFCHNGGTCFQGTLNNNADYYCICPKGTLGYRCENEDSVVLCTLETQQIFCFNQGSCTVVMDTQVEFFYVCSCQDGYGGKRCEYVNHRINKCPVSLETSLCLNDGNCSVFIFIGYVIYYCECPEGYYGPRCQETFPGPGPGDDTTCSENIDQHFCLNGGTCHQTVSQKLVVNYCNCVEGYWGERCEYSSSDQTNCSQAFDQFYCLNGGTCYKLTVGKEIFNHCECLKNFYGTRCEALFPVPGPESQRCVGDIDTYFCQNGGTCYQIMVNNEVFYFCACLEGWTGLRCENGPVHKQSCPDELVEVYCLNNGTCIKLKVESQELYYCRCAKGFEGPRCEYHLPNSNSSACAPPLNEIYCLNGGTCSEMIVSEQMFYTCDCPECFWGKQCEFTTFIRNFCPAMLDTSFCLNGGTCYQLLVDDKDLYYCVCTNNHYGSRCEKSYIETNESQRCPPRLSEGICLHGGLCYQLRTSEHPVFYCECAKGYVGKRCEIQNKLSYVGDLHVSYLNLQHSLETSSSSVRLDIHFFLFLLWFTLCCKTVF